MARVHVRSLAKPAGSNPAGSMDVCLLWVCCRVKRSLRRADRSCWGVLPRVVCHCVDLMISAQMRPWPASGCCAKEEKGIFVKNTCQKKNTLFVIFHARNRACSRRWINRSQYHIVPHKNTQNTIPYIWRLYGTSFRPTVQIYCWTSMEEFKKNSD